MSTLREKWADGYRTALAAFSLPAQPALGAVGIKAPTTAPGLPNAPKPPTVGKPPTVSVSPPSVPSVGSGGAPKIAFNVGMGASTSGDTSGAAAGEPVDTGRRQQSVVDRAFQRNEDDYATSSMPLPGAVVSP